MTNGHLKRRKIHQRVRDSFFLTVILRYLFYFPNRTLVLVIGLLNSSVIERSVLVESCEFCLIELGDNEGSKVGKLQKMFEHRCRVEMKEQKISLLAHFFWQKWTENM